MLPQANLVSHSTNSIFLSPPLQPVTTSLSPPPTTSPHSHSLSLSQTTTMASNSHSNTVNAIQQPSWEDEIDSFVEVANDVADAAGEVIRKYFRKIFDIIDKDDFSPVTIADQTAEEVIVSIIFEKLPSHAIFLAAVLRERWIGISGRRTTLNNQEVSTRSCATISQAYMYTTSPHLFKGDAEEAFIRVRDKVKVPLYGCDCYAYALLASGFVDLVVESGLKPYDFLSLIPVIEGAGGTKTDWKGHQLIWEASPDSHATSFNVVAAGDKQVHQQALDLLQWQ